MTSLHSKETICTASKTFRIALPDCMEYQQLSRLIESVFKRAYEAEVLVTYPQLLGVYANDGNPQSALGMRGAHEQKLFLEYYLDKPAQQVIFDKTRLRFTRSKIAEAGNLASMRITALRDLMFALSIQLKQEGFEYILFTGTESLRRYLQLLGMEPVVYAKADPARLPEGSINWGKYYDTNPMVMGGAVDTFYYGLISAYSKRGSHE